MLVDAIVQAREPTPEDYDALRRIAAGNVHQRHHAPTRAHEVWLERLLARAARAIRKIRRR